MILKKNDKVKSSCCQTKTSPRAYGRARTKTIAVSVVIVLVILFFLMKKQGIFGLSSKYPPEVFSIFYTCDTSGHIEPCGCVGGMAGGISRRQTSRAGGAKRLPPCRRGRCHCWLSSLGNSRAGVYSQRL